MKYSYLKILNTTNSDDKTITEYVGRYASNQKYLRKEIRGSDSQHKLTDKKKNTILKTTMSSDKK